MDRQTDRQTDRKEGVEERIFTGVGAHVSVEK